MILDGDLMIGHLIEFQQVLLDFYLQQHIQQRNKGLFDLQAPLPFADSDIHAVHFLMDLLRQLIDEVKLASHRILFQPCLFLFLWQLNRKVAELTIKPTEHERIVQKFMLLLEEHYVTKRNAPFYAGEMGINARKLQYVLDKMTGTRCDI